VLTDFEMGPSGIACSGGSGFDECPDLNAATFTSADAGNPVFVIIGGDFDHRNVGTYSYDECGGSHACTYPKMWRDLNACGNWGASDLCGHVLRKYPLVHAWDDHDYNTNNAKGSYSNKFLAYQWFARYFPSYPLPQCTNQCAGIWQKFSYAYADFFVLDSRSQRTAPCATPPTCSGTESMLKGFTVQGADDQLTWLKNGLLNSTATWKFIWSPVVFNKTLLKTDSWFGYPAERDALVAWINGSNPQQKVIKNVVVLSGDLHVGAIHDGVTGLGGQLPEMVSPAVNLTNSSPQHCQSAANSERGNWSNGMYTTGGAGTDPCNGYGVISVTPNAVTLTVKDSNGNADNLICVPTNFQPCSSHQHISPLTIPVQ
jgi:alkaline phosphatase D